MDARRVIKWSNKEANEQEGKDGWIMRKEEEEFPVNSVRPIISALSMGAAHTCPVFSPICGILMWPFEF